VEKKKLGLVAQACHPSNGKKLNRRIVQAGLGKKQDPLSKITRAKITAGVVQAVKHLPHKHQALSSNPSSTNNLKNKLNNAGNGDTFL
jgi:hypothetical protein